MTQANCPLATQLKALPRDQCVPLIERAFSERVAAMFGVKAESIDVDAPFPKLAPALRDVSMRWSGLIEPWVKECLGFRQFHLYEASLSGSIGELARYLAGELEPIPVPTTPLENLDDRSKWGWSALQPLARNAGVPGKMAFVLGAGRSGTSLFRTMLTCHEQVYAPSELHLLSFNDMGQRRDDMQRHWQQWMDIGLIETLRVEFGMSQWEAILELNILAAGALPVAEVYARIQSRMAGRWLVDKTPSYARNPDCLVRAEQLFADPPKYLFLTRHPYAVMDSFIKSRFYRFSGPIWGFNSRNPWQAAEIYWTVTNRNVLAFLKTIPVERWARFTYEGLMQDSDNVLGEVCRLLSLPYDERMRDPFQSGASITGFLADRNRVDYSLADAWRDKRPPHPLSRLTREIADELGYPLS